MKNCIITWMLLGITLTAFSQNVRYEVRGRYERPVIKEKLRNARFISDFMPGYPGNWITNYTSVQISTILNGKVLSAKGINDSLTSEQRNILNAVSLASEVLVDVKYKNRNAVTNEFDDRNMKVSMTVIPETQAEPAGGNDKLAMDLKRRLAGKKSEAIADFLQDVLVVFTIDENGKAVNVKISKSSGDTSTDQALLEIINEMPNWKPATNSNGIKVKQEFEFRVGQSGC